VLFGYQAVFDADFADAIAYAADHRFDYVQFDLNVPRFFLDDLTARDLDRIRGAADGRGVRLSFHAPGDNVSLFTDYPAARDGLLRQMAVILERANDLGARHLTVHPGAPPTFRKAGEDDRAFRSEHWDHYKRVLADNLGWIADRAREVLVCVENSGAVDLAFEAIAPLLDAAAPLSLCWDFAKSQRQPGAGAYFGANAAHVREVHVHDIDSHGHGHGKVGDGTLDFGRYAALIERTDVATTIEVRPREAATESRDTLVRMLSAARGAGVGVPERMERQLDARGAVGPRRLRANHGDQAAEGRDTMDCEGRVALVTGASGSGLGRSIALTLAREGARVVVNYRATQGRADAVVEHIRAKGGSACAVRADVFEADDCRRLVEKAIAEFGAIDICVVGPGGGWHPDSVDRLPADDALEDLRHETAPLYFLMPLVLPGMEERRWGRLIGIASHPVKVSPAYAYNVGKAARTQALLLAQDQLWSKGVTVNVIAPGPVAGIPDLEAAVEQSQRGASWRDRRDVSPQDIAEGVRFLCSESGRFVTGCCLPYLFNR
jgi:3-oxoacyl-[acyl-carrier protein] reductase